MIERVTDPNDARIAAYRNMRGYAPTGTDNTIVVESPKVINTALDAGLEPLSLLCEEKHICGDAAAIIARCPAGMPVYTGARAILENITGYTLTRGVLCVMRRPERPPLEDIAAGKGHRLAVLDGVCDTTNIGAVFRSAAALGWDGVVLTPGTCDPFNRRSIRVSMGTVFQVPWTWCRPDFDDLRQCGYHPVAMALKPDSVPLDEPSLQCIDQLALVLGTEGDGLSKTAIDACDRTVIIPMQHGVDSLNVSNAAAIAFWQLRYKDITPQQDNDKR